MPLEMPFDEVLDILLLDITQASQPVDGTITAAQIYSLTGRLFTPEYILGRYFDLIRRFGSRDKADKAIQPLRDKFYEEVRQVKGPSYPSRARQGLSCMNLVDPKDLLDCLDRCSASPLAHVFHDPVDPNIYMTYNRANLGPYSLTVKKPMHLGLLRTRIDQGVVDTWDMLLSDILLMISNCVFFNAPEGEYPKSARIFLEHCLRCLEEDRKRWEETTLKERVGSHRYPEGESPMCYHPEAGKREGGGSPSLPGTPTSREVRGTGRGGGRAGAPRVWGMTAGVKKRARD